MNNLFIITPMHFRFSLLLVHPAPHVCKASEMAWRAALFHKVFSRYLLATNTVATAFLYGMGDCIQQKVFERTDQQHNWERTKRMAIMGLVQGPIDHYWFQVLEKRLPLKTPKMIAIKVVLGELVIGTSSIGIFFTGKSNWK